MYGYNYCGINEPVNNGIAEIPCANRPINRIGEHVSELNVQELIKMFEADTDKLNPQGTQLMVGCNGGGKEKSPTIKSPVKDGSPCSQMPSGPRSDALDGCFKARPERRFIMRTINYYDGMGELCTDPLLV